MNCIHDWEFVNYESQGIVCTKCGTYLDRTDAMNRLNMLESDLANTRAIYAEQQAQLASLQSRLAAYEEGFDPKVKLPASADSDVLINIGNDIFYVATYWKYSGNWNVTGSDFSPTYDTADVKRWFPLPGSKGGDE